MRKAIAAILVALAIGSFGCADSEPTQQVDQNVQAAQTAEDARTAQTAIGAQQQHAAAPTQDQDTTVAEPEQEAQESVATESAEAPAQPQQAHPQQEQPQQGSQQAGRTESEQPQIEPVPEGTRIVSLFGDVTEILFALGVEDHIVGVDVSSVFPEAAQELPDVGFAGALNAEGVLALSPTIVIGGSIVVPGPPGVLDQLEQAGVEVLVLPELIGLDSPGIKIRAIGDALGIPRRAEQLAQRVEAEIETARPELEGSSSDRLSVLFVYLRRGGIQLVSGAGREAETIITAAGGIDAGAAAGIEGWQPLSPEALLAINPDVYLVMQLGYDAVGELAGLLEIPGMAETEAGKHRRVIVMEDILLLGFGPRMAESIVQLRDYLAEVQDSLQDSTQDSADPDQ